MIIRKALYSDLDNVLFVERAAFGSDEEANLVRDLLGDESAKPIVSLLAFQENQAVGHILFTKARLESKAPLSISIRATYGTFSTFKLGATYGTFSTFKLGTCGTSVKK